MSYSILVNVRLPDGSVMFLPLVRPCSSVSTVFESRFDAEEYIENVLSTEVKILSDKEELEEQLAESRKRESRLYNKLYAMNYSREQIEDIASGKGA